MCYFRRDKRESLNTIQPLSNLSAYWFFWLKQVFCLCALECEAAVLSRYEGLHYQHHSAPFPRQVHKLGSCCSGGKLHTLPGLWAGHFFFEELYTWQVVQVQNEGVWSETTWEKVVHSKLRFQSIWPRVSFWLLETLHEFWIALAWKTAVQQKTDFFSASIIHLTI